MAICAGQAYHGRSVPSDLRQLWLRVVADSRRELERLREECPVSGLDRDLDKLFAAHWPQARQAAIKGLAREEAGDDERLYRAACRRLDRDLPREYPYAHAGDGDPAG